jgi:hypothetical protein
MLLYRFITGPDDEHFCLRVSESLNNGWQLHAGPTLTFNGQTCIAGQAVVKEVPEEEFSPKINLRAY